MVKALVTQFTENLCSLVCFNSSYSNKVMLLVLLI